MVSGPQEVLYHVEECQACSRCSVKLVIKSCLSSYLASWLVFHFLSSLDPSHVSFTFLKSPCSILPLGLFPFFIPLPGPSTSPNNTYSSFSFEADITSFWKLPQPTHLSLGFSTCTFPMIALFRLSYPFQLHHQIIFVLHTLIHLALSTMCGTLLLLSN